MADLATYPRWLGIVLAATPDDAGQAWRVQIGARLGPLRRAKTLRMTRTDAQPPDHVRFERHELDGKQHSPWVLTVDLTGDTDLAVHLHYGGGLVVPGLQQLLQQEIRRAPGRLFNVLAD